MLKGRRATRFISASLLCTAKEKSPGNPFVLLTLRNNYKQRKVLLDSAGLTFVGEAIFNSLSLDERRAVNYVVEHHKVKPTDLVRVGGGNWHRSKKVLEQLKARGILNANDVRIYSVIQNHFIISNIRVGRMKNKTSKEPSEEYSRFEQLAKQLIAVPKSEIDKREAEYQKHKKAGKKRRVA